MTAVFLTAALVVTAALQPALVPLAFLLGIVVALVAGAVHGAHAGTPQTISRLPTAYERNRGRRWRLGFGLALGFHGLFPFIYVTRRLR